MISSTLYKISDMLYMIYRIEGILSTKEDILFIQLNKISHLAYYISYLVYLRYLY